MLLCISSFFSLDRGSYTKGLPQIRIDGDSEENGFFWKKGSETDLWMNFSKDTAQLTIMTILFCTIVPLRNGVLIFLLCRRKSEWLEVFVLKLKQFGGTEY